MLLFPLHRSVHYSEQPQPRQEPLKEDSLSPAEIDQLVDGVLKSFEDPEVTKDPYMSPALAPDEMLIGLPVVHLVVRGN